MRVDALERIRIRPTRTDIDHGVDVETIREMPIDDGIDFHEYSGFLGHGPRFVTMPSLPLGVLRHSCSLERAFHTRETDFVSVLRKQVVQHFCAASMLSAVGEDCFHELMGELMGMGVRTGALSRNRMTGVVQLCIVHPAHDGALVEACVTSDCSRTPALVQD